MLKWDIVIGKGNVEVWADDDSSWSVPTKLDGFGLYMDAMGLKS